MAATKFSPRLGGPQSWDDRTCEAVALVATALILALVTAFLMQGQRHAGGGSVTRLRVFLIPRPGMAETAALPPAATPGPAADGTRAPGVEDRRLPQPQPSSRRRPAMADAAATDAPAKDAAPPPPQLMPHLYRSDGRVRLPESAAAPAPAAAPPGKAGEPARTADADRLFERPNPIEYRATRFERDAAADRTPNSLGEALGKRISELLDGKRTAATARPPPEIRFNPALHERPADLGREQTGDAYKAAPIAFEKAPGLQGEASRRIAEAASTLERRAAGCGKDRVDGLLAPVQGHLADLRRIEYAMAHGPDPVQAEHLWPRAADSAYDLARRGLWHAEHKLQACLVPGQRPGGAAS